MPELPAISKVHQFSTPFSVMKMRAQQLLPLWRDLQTRITPTIEFIEDGLPESAKAMDSLLDRVHALDAEVAKLRMGAKPTAEDPYKAPRVIED